MIICIQSISYWCILFISFTTIQFIIIHGVIVYNLLTCIELSVCTSNALFQRFICLAM